jgi:putative restriction endonuclease
MTERELEQVADIDEAELPKEGKERERIVRARVNQHFFRVTVLASYDFRCCITGLAIPELLTASHIAAWSRDPKNRMNPRNGLALNALHDRAFDRGLMGIGPDWKVRFAPVLKRQRTMHDEGLAWLLKFEGKEIARPRKFHPDAELLAEHRKRYNL